MAMAKSARFHWCDADDATFRGRDELIVDLEAGMARGDSFALIGQRGMGKTMLLRRMLGRSGHLGDGCSSCLLSVSGREESPFFLIKQFAESLIAVLSRKEGIDPELSKRRLHECVTPTADRPLLRLIALAEDFLGHPASVNLLLDNVHRFQELAWGQDFLANLEHELFSNRLHSTRLRVVLAGDLRMIKYLEDMPFSGLWQHLRNIWLHALSSDDIADLLRVAIPSADAGTIEYLASAVDSWSGGHPSITQYILRDLARNHSGGLTSVESSGLRFIAELSKMLDSSWSTLHDESRSVIRYMCDRGEAVEVSELSGLLKGRQVHWSRALSEVASSGFLRVSDKRLFPPREVVRLWLDAPEEEPEKVGISGFALGPSGCDPHFPTVLHLTDIHFGGDGHAWNQSEEIYGANRPEHDKVTLLDTLLFDVEKLRKQYGVWPRVVLVTGDLLFQCRKEGVGEAVAFLSSLADRLGVGRDDVVLCAGNHEHNRDLVKEAPGVQFSRYIDIWNGFYGTCKPRLSLDSMPYEYVHLYTVDNMEILSMNSCEDLVGSGNSSQQVDSREQGYIGAKQLGRAEELLGAKRADANRIRVAALHHHLSQYRWAGGADYSILRDVDRVIRWLREFHFDLVFHGHQHVSGLHTRVEDRRFLTILAGGSAGVSSAYRWRGGMPLMYQMVFGLKPNRALRLCRVFDLHAEEWAEKSSDKPQEIPLGFL